MFPEKPEDGDRQDLPNRQILKSTAKTYLTKLPEKVEITVFQPESQDDMTGLASFYGWEVWLL